MRTNVERIDDKTVKLTVTVEASRVDAALDEAAKHLAKEVRVPGFRPGKAPRRVLEQRVGTEALVDHAMRDSVPDFYREAVEAEEVDAVGRPEFDVETFAAGEDATFSATVEVRPEVELPDYEGMRIAHPDWEVTDEEVEEQLEGLRERFAELETVERPARAGDHVLISLTAEQGGEPLEDVAEDDVLYEINDPEESGQELDRQAVGAEAGSVFSFTDTLGEDYGEHAGKEVDVRVLVKEVKAKRLPDLDDDFAITASEFDTIDELRADVARQMRREKRERARGELRGHVVEQIAEQVDVELPEALVDQETQFRLQRIAGQAQQYGMELEQFLELTGTDAQELVDQLREQARETVKAQLVVDAVGKAAGVEVGEDDLEEEIARQAERLGQDPDELAEFMTAPERLPALVADAFRRKAIDHLLDRVQVLSPPPEDDSDLGAAGADDERGDDDAE